MFKSYIVSIIGFLLGVGVIVYAQLYTKAYSNEDLKQGYSFNAASIEQKLLGKTLEEVSEQYLAPESLKKQKGKGNMIARYENIKIFTRGEKTIINGMDITYKNGVAASIKYDEPRKSKDAIFANYSPLAFFFMDKEFLTKDQEVINTKKAEKWQIPLLILLLVFLVNIPFLLSWPLATLMAKKIGGGVSVFLALVLWLALYWIYLGIAAYAIGTAMIFLILGGVWILIALGAFARAARPVYSAPSGYDPSDYDTSSPSSGPAPSYQPPLKPKTDDPAVQHLQNLAALLSLSYAGKLPVDAKTALISDIATREQVDIESFKYAMNNITLEAPKHVSGQRKMQFIDDIAAILACETSFSNPFFGAAIMIAEHYGLESNQFLGRVKAIAKMKYQRDFPGDYTVIDNQ